MQQGRGNDRLEWMRERLRTADRAAMRRRLVPRRMDGPYLIDGDRRLVNFGANDYLGIAMDASAAAPGASDRGGAQSRIDRSSEAVRLAEMAQGSGAGASPLVCGFTPLHARLCDELATLEQTESAILFPSGFAACSGTVAALAEAGDLILSDALNHASLIDGCRLSKATRFIYPTCDHRAVAALLAAHRQNFSRVFIVTDSIFSMDGTRAPLVELADLADRFDAMLVVDEAHATGVLGSHGAGLCDELELDDRIPVRIGTLSKAIGAHGGFVVGPRVVTDYLLQRARPLIYSTAAPPAVIAAARAGVQTVRDQPQRRSRVLQLSRWVAERLSDSGRKLIASGTPIIPVILGDAAEAIAASKRLEQAGFYVPAIRPPTVPPGTARLRISLSASHSDQMVEDLCRAIIAATA